MALSLDSMITLSKDQVSCDLSGETAILGLQSGQYFGLDEVGSRLWSLMEKPQSVRRMRDAVVSEYAVDTETCTQDVLRFLKDLERAGLIEVR